MVAVVPHQEGTDGRYRDDPMAAARSTLGRHRVEPGDNQEPTEIEISGRSAPRVVLRLVR